VELLIKNGADVTAKTGWGSEKTPRDLAINFGPKDIAELLTITSHNRDAVEQVVTEEANKSIVPQPMRTLTEEQGYMTETIHGLIHWIKKKKRKKWD